MEPLLEVAEQAEPGRVFVIERYRGLGKNLRTHFNRIVERAGLEPWGKPFQNMRSSRETELCEKFPLHVVCKWIGNSVPVAKKFYLQVTQEHYRQASEEGNSCTNCTDPGDSKTRSEPTKEEEPPREWMSNSRKIDKTFLIAKPMGKVSWTKCFVARGGSVRGGLEGWGRWG